MSKNNSKKEQNAQKNRTLFALKTNAFTYQALSELAQLENVTLGEKLREAITHEK
ncbi:hypothetical protein [Deinococcus roseus]|uniref:Uncharacterized protein n=1 Tax=Deinococcus roseus TaxID=392414 RepID=A0ABQ2D7H9_9DEIO|nr:hypothetical protein [Deinococcus roseus]GGJ44480.1 hypothetical protein GCM10008938_33360 [Deinococcus roseus]